MIDAYQDLWNAMTKEQRKGISWLAVLNKGDRILGDMQHEDLLTIASVALNEYARFESRDYEEYREQVIAACKGLAQGMLDGGMDYYLSKRFK